MISSRPCQCMPTLFTHWASSRKSLASAFMSCAFQASSNPATIFRTA